MDSERFMASSSNLVDNLAEGIQKIIWKDFSRLLDYESVNDNLTKYKCLSCHKNYSSMIDEKSKMIFKNTFKFLIMILMNLIYYWAKLFILMNIWSGNFLLYHQTCFLRKICEFYFQRLHIILVDSAEHLNWRLCSQKTYVFLNFVEKYLR